MKTWWLPFVLLLILSGCLPDKARKNDPEPELELAGTYQMVSFVSNNVTLIPRSGVSGSVNVVKLSDTQLSVSFSVNNNGRVSNSAAATVSITKSSGTVYDLVENGSRIGTIDGSTFSLDSSTGTDDVYILAKK
jgi:hypothetical protein